MPLPQRVQYPDAIEPLVQFIEETPPAEILDRTLDKLRAGVPTETMLTASALAVTRSSDLPPGHHGGPLHPLAGLYALSNLVERAGRRADASAGPAARRAVEQAHQPSGDGPVSACSNSRRVEFGGVEAAKEAFLTACQPRRVQQGRPHLPVAVGQRPARSRRSTC